MSLSEHAKRIEDETGSCIMRMSGVEPSASLDLFYVYAGRCTDDVIYAAPLEPTMGDRAEFIEEGPDVYYERLPKIVAYNPRRIQSLWTDGVCDRIHTVSE